VGHGAVLAGLGDLMPLLGLLVSRNLLVFVIVLVLVLVLVFVLMNGGHRQWHLNFGRSHGSGRLRRRSDRRVPTSQGGVALVSFGVFRRWEIVAEVGLGPDVL